ncbi:MAG: hypothetical protein IJ009_07285 [Clostridia bacterium]|nr:hypothetical protein [Clostridia bacterium]
MIFRETFKVNSHSCDYNGIVRPGAVITYLQEAANLQLETYGPSDAEMREQGQFFVLSRLGMALSSPIRAYETLTAETWSAPSRGFSFLRCHRLLRGGEVICEACSVWALLGLEDKHPLRVDAYRPNFDDEPLSAFGMPDRVRVDAARLSEVGKHTVRYVDTDRNQHMNNTVYADMLSGFLDLHGVYVSRLSINYFHEAPIGMTLSVFHAYANDGLHVFRTLREDGETNVEAAFTLADL